MSMSPTTEAHTPNDCSLDSHTGDTLAAVLRHAMHADTKQQMKQTETNNNDNSNKKDSNVKSNGVNTDKDGNETVETVPDPNPDSSSRPSLSINTDWARSPIIPISTDELEDVQGKSFFKPGSVDSDMLERTSAANMLRSSFASPSNAHSSEGVRGSYLSPGAVTSPNSADSQQLSSLSAGNTRLSILGCLREEAGQGPTRPTTSPPIGTRANENPSPTPAPNRGSLPNNLANFYTHQPNNNDSRTYNETTTRNKSLRPSATQGLFEGRAESKYGRGGHVRTVSEGACDVPKQPAILCYYEYNYFSASDSFVELFKLDYEALQDILSLFPEEEYNMIRNRANSVGFRRMSSVAAVALERKTSIEMKLSATDPSNPATRTTSPGSLKTVTGSPLEDNQKLTSPSQRSDSGGNNLSQLSAPKKVFRPSDRMSNIPRSLTSERNPLNTRRDGSFATPTYKASFSLQAAKETSLLQTLPTRAISYGIDGAPMPGESTVTPDGEDDPNCCQTVFCCIGPVIWPTSIFRFAWELCGLILFLINYVFILYALMITLDPTIESDTKDRQFSDGALLFCYYFIDTFFAVDILLNMFHFAIPSLPGYRSEDKESQEAVESEGMTENNTINNHENTNHNNDSNDGVSPTITVGRTTNKDGSIDAQSPLRRLSTLKRTTSKSSTGTDEQHSRNNSKAHLLGVLSALGTMLEDPEFTAETTTIEDREQIRDIYLKGWFFVDFLGTFPWEIFAFMSGVRFSSMVYFRLPRLMRMSKYHRNFKALEYFLKRLGISAYVVRFAREFLLLLLFVYMAATVWILASFTQVDLDDVENDLSWRSRDPGRAVDGSDELYGPGLGGMINTVFRAVYFIFVSMNTLGSGDIRAVGPLEMSISMIVMIIGMFFVPTFIGVLTSASENLGAVKINFSTKQQTIQSQMTAMRAPFALRKLCVEYFSYCWLYAPVGQEVIGQLPLRLRSLVQDHVIDADELRERVSFLKRVEPIVLSDFASSLIHKVYPPNINIIREDTITPYFILILKGSVKSHRNYKAWHIPPPYKTILREGDTFGVPYFMSNAPIPYSIDTLEYVEVVIGTKSGLEATLEQYPNAKTRILRNLRSQRLAHKAINKWFRNISFRPEHQVHTEEKNTKSILPDSVFRSRWTVLCLIVTIYYCIMIPIRIAFYADPSKYNNYDANGMRGALIALDYICDILMWIDMYLHLNKFAVLHDGELLTEPEQFRPLYMKSNMPLDLFALLPFGILLAGGGNGYLMPLFRFNRVFRFFRIFGYTRDVIDETSKYIAVQKLLILFYFILQITIWTASIWFASTFNGWGGDAFEWRATSWVINDDLIDEPVARQILRSGYWALGVNFIIFCGDIVPVSFRETVIFVSVVVVIMPVYANFVSNISTIITNSDSVSLSFSVKRHQVRAFCLSHKLPDDLVHKINVYYDRIQTYHSSIESTHVWKQMPDWMRVKMTRSLIFPTLIRIKLFLHVDVGFLEQLMEYMEPAFFVPGQFMFRQGEMSHQLYIVFHGSCQRLKLSLQTEDKMPIPENDIYDHDKQTHTDAEFDNSFEDSDIEDVTEVADDETAYESYKILCEHRVGDYFCSQSLVRPHQHETSMRARSFVQVMILAKEDLDATLDTFPEDRLTILGLQLYKERYGFVGKLDQIMVRAILKAKFNSRRHQLAAEIKDGMALARIDDYDAHSGNTSNSNSRRSTIVGESSEPESCPSSEDVKVTYKTEEFNTERTAGAAPSQTALVPVVQRHNFVTDSHMPSSTQTRPPKPSFSTNSEFRTSNRSDFRTSNLSDFRTSNRSDFRTQSSMNSNISDDVGLFPLRSKSKSSFGNPSSSITSTPLLHPAKSSSSAPNLPSTVGVGIGVGVGSGSAGTFAYQTTAGKDNPSVGGKINTSQINPGLAPRIAGGGVRSNNSHSSEGDQTHKQNSLTLSIKEQKQLVETSTDQKTTTIHHHHHHHHYHLHASGPLAINIKSDTPTNRGAQHTEVELVPLDASSATTAGVDDKSDQVGDCKKATTTFLPRTNENAELSPNPANRAPTANGRVSSSPLLLPNSASNAAEGMVVDAKGVPLNTYLSSRHSNMVPELRLPGATVIPSPMVPVLGTGVDLTIKQHDSNKINRSSKSSNGTRSRTNTDASLASTRDEMIQIARNTARLRVAFGDVDSLGDGSNGKKGKTSFYRNFLSLICRLYYLVVVPWQICFESFVYENWFCVPIMIINLLVDGGMMYAGIVKIKATYAAVKRLHDRLQSSKAKQKEAEAYEMSLSRLLAKQIWGTVLGILPVDWLILLFAAPLVSNDDIDYAFHIANWMRLTKLIHMTLTAQALASVLKRARVSPTSIRVVNVLLAYVAVIHWFGCALFYTAWRERKDMSWYNLLGLDLPERDGLFWWLRCVYWVCTTISTTGYGDLKPRTNIETALVMCVTVLGGLMFSVLVGAFTSIALASDAAATASEQRKRGLTRYAQERGLPESILSRIKAYYDYLWENEEGLELIGILKSLPLGLRNEVLHFHTYDILSAVPLFLHSDPGFLSSLVTQLRPIMCPPGDDIIKQGEIGDAMFMIYRGAVEVYDVKAPDIVLATLMKGSFFGEVALILDQTRSKSVRACEMYCMFFVLNREGLDYIVQFYPNMIDVLETKAKEFQRRHAKNQQRINRKNMRLSRKKSYDHKSHSPSPRSSHPPSGFHGNSSLDPAYNQNSISISHVAPTDPSRSSGREFNSAFRESHDSVVIENSSSLQPSRCSVTITPTAAGNDDNRTNNTLDITTTTTRTSSNTSSRSYDNRASAVSIRSVATSTSQILRSPLSRASAVGDLSLEKMKPRISRSAILASQSSNASKSPASPFASPPLNRTLEDDNKDKKETNPPTIVPLAPLDQPTCLDDNKPAAVGHDDHDNDNAIQPLIALDHLADQLVDDTTDGAKADKTSSALHGRKSSGVQRRLFQEQEKE